MSTICGRRSLSGLSRCDQPTGHTGLHIDSRQGTSFQLHAGPHDPARATPPVRLPDVVAEHDDVICAWRLPLDGDTLDLLHRVFERNHPGATIAQSGRYLLVREAATVLA